MIEPGYYWIKGEELTIGYYDGERKEWYFIGTELPDEEIDPDTIGPRIYPPEELVWPEPSSS